MSKLEVKKKQIEIAFDGINQKFIKELLLDIQDAGKRRLRRQESYIVLNYEHVQIDTFNAICERFGETPEYKSYSKCWCVHINLAANGEDRYTFVHIIVSSEKQVIEFQYDNKGKLSKS